MYDAICARTLAMFTVLVAVTAAAQAQATSGLRYGTKEDLRQCMDSEDKLKAEQPLIRQTMEKHRLALTQFQEEMQAHVALQKAVDTSDEKAVAAFNDRTDTLNSRVDVINREAAEHQSKVDEFNARMYAQNKRCAGMIYRIPDMRALEKDRAAAAKARAGKPS